MLGKPAARKPPNVLVTADEVIRIGEDLKSGTCFLPKMDEDELLCGYQNDKNKEAKDKKAKKAAEAAKKREAEARAARAAAYLANDPTVAAELGKTVKFAPNVGNASGVGIE